MHHTHVCFCNIPFAHLYATLKDMLEEINVFEIFYEILFAKINTNLNESY